MPALDRYIPPVPQEFDTAAANGLDAGSGFKLEFFASGTTTPKDTYSDKNRNTPNSNPVVADSAGRFGSIFMGTGSYRVVLKDADDVTIWTRDDVAGGYATEVSEALASANVTGFLGAIGSYDLVANHADGPTAADTAYAAGVPLYVKNGETAYLTCDPTNGDDIQQMFEWFSSCKKDEGGTFYILLADGEHEVSTGILMERPGLTIDFRASGSPDAVTATAITSALVVDTTYRATVTVSTALPDQVIVGSPIGMQNIQGDNDALAFNGGQVVQSIAGDRLSFTYDFFSPAGAPTDPSALDNTAINGMTPNQVLCPQAWLVCDENGWDGGTQEGFIALRGGAKCAIQDIGFVFDGTAAGDDHMIAVRDTGSFIHIVQDCVFAGAGDKVIRQTFGAGSFINRSCIGGAFKARVAIDLAVGCSGTVVRCSLGGFSNQICNVGASSGISFTSCCGGASTTGIQIPNSGAGAGVLYSLSQFGHCVSGLYAQNGCINVTENAASILTGMTHAQRSVDDAGKIVGEATFSNNTNNITVDNTTYTPTLSNTTNIDSSTAVQCRYQKRDRKIYVFGRVSVTPTAASNTLTELGISLPVASNFADTKDLVGNAAAHQLSAAGSVVMDLIADTTNDRALLSFYSASTSAHTIHFRFEYQVI